MINDKSIRGIFLLFWIEMICPNYLWVFLNMLNCGYLVLHIIIFKYPVDLLPLQIFIDGSFYKIITWLRKSYIFDKSEGFRFNVCDFFYFEKYTYVCHFNLLNPNSERCGRILVWPTTVEKTMSTFISWSRSGSGTVLCARPSLTHCHLRWLFLMQIIP